MMQRAKLALTAWLGAIALGTVGCNVQIEQIFAMQPGSGVDVSQVKLDQSELFLDHMTFEGGVVMRIDVSTDLLDYLDGTVDGDVTILDLLFGIPNFKFFFVNTGLLCVVLDDPPGGGTFAYDVLAQQASFDVLVNTKAVVTNPLVAPMMPGGAFKFPFDLEASMPLTLVDALGLVTGTGSITVAQHLDNIFIAEYYPDKANYPNWTVPLKMHVVGDVTLTSTDTFPTPPIVLSCLDYLGS
jgi:hypothetical protein